jgi:hypothetical protein
VVPAVEDVVAGVDHFQVVEAVVVVVLVALEGAFIPVVETIKF